MIFYLHFFLHLKFICIISVGIYSEPSGELECILEGQKGGVTQLQFSPDGNLLYSGGRKVSYSYCVIVIC